MGGAKNILAMDLQFGNKSLQGQCKHVNPLTVLNVSEENMEKNKKHYQMCVSPVFETM